MAWQNKLWSILCRSDHPSFKVVLVGGPNSMRSLNLGREHAYHFVLINQRRKPIQ